MDADRFLDVVSPRKRGERWTRLGKIDPAYSTGLPKVMWDGEANLSTRSYPHLASYSPAADDRVLAVRSGRTWVIVGKVTS